MSAPREKISASFTIYKGLPFKATMKYQSPRGAAIDIGTWIGKLVVKADVDSPEEPLAEFKTSNDSMTLGLGVIEFTMDAVATALLEWEEGVGHLVIGPDQNDVKPIAFFGFKVQPCTTDVPDA